MFAGSDCLKKKKEKFGRFLIPFFLPLLVLGIRHPEELSFCKPLEPNHLKYNLEDLNSKRKNPENLHNGQIPSDTNTFIATEAHNGSNGSLDRNSPYMCAPMTPSKQGSTPLGVSYGS